jgi:hypothetical protein
VRSAAHRVGGETAVALAPRSEAAAAGAPSVRRAIGIICRVRTRWAHRCSQRHARSLPRGLGRRRRVLHRTPSRSRRPGSRVRQPTPALTALRPCLGAGGPTGDPRGGSAACWASQALTRPCRSRAWRSQRSRTVSLRERTRTGAGPLGCPQASQRRLTPRRLRTPSLSSRCVFRRAGWRSTVRRRHG